MNEKRRVYAARPINTYVRSADVGVAFLEHLTSHFKDCELVDPNSQKIQNRAKELKELHSIDPVTGEYSEKYYNEVGGSKVMEFFTNEVVGSCSVGAGLALPVDKDGKTVFMVGAGVAAELAKMFQAERNIWIVTCSLNNGQMNFVMHYVLNMKFYKERSIWMFATENISCKGEYNVFMQMTVDETRARMYTPNPAGGWNRDKLQPYFL